MTHSIEQAEQRRYSVQEAQQFIEEMTSTETMPYLISAFNVVIPEDYDNLNAIEKISWLKGFAGEHLDTRKGKERWETEEAIYTPDQEAAISAFAHEFGMEGETNANRDKYGFISILGGANQAPLLRMRHAKKQIEAGVSAPYMLLLGSERPIIGKERENTANYAPGAETEFDLMNAALETEFKLTAIDEISFDLGGTRPDRWKIRYYDMPDGMRVLSVSAPRIEGDKRANTADTYRFINEIVGKEMLNTEKSILAVTTDLYVPFQHADALRLLALPNEDMEIETIGYGGIERPPKAYAGEINSAIRQTYRLNEALGAIDDAMTAEVALSNEVNHDFDMLAEKAAFMERIRSRVAYDLPESMYLGKAELAAKTFGSPRPTEEQAALDRQILIAKENLERALERALALYEQLYDIDPQRVRLDDPKSMGTFFTVAQIYVRLDRKMHSISKAETMVDTIAMLLAKEYAPDKRIDWPSIQKRFLYQVIDDAYGLAGKVNDKRELNEILGDMRYRVNTPAEVLVELPKIKQQLLLLRDQQPARIARFLERYKAGEDIHVSNAIE